MNRKAASRVAHRRSAAGHVPGLLSHSARLDGPAPASRGRHGRHLRAGPGGGMQRQPVLGRFRRLTDWGSGQRTPRMREGRRMPRWSPSPAACVPMAWRTSPTPRLAPATQSSPARNNSGSAAPSSARLRPPASACSRSASTTSFLSLRCRFSCAACSLSPAACAPTESRTSPIPPSTPRGALFSRYPRTASA